MGSNALARTNKATILECLRAHGPLSRTDIARITGLSMATSSRLVTALLNDDLVVTAGANSTGSGGRPSIKVRFNSAAAVTLAVAVMDRHTDIALIDLDARVIHQDRYEGPPNPEERIRQTVELVERGFARAHEDGHRCVAVGVSVPGPVDDGVVGFAPALSWHRVPLETLLEQRVPVPIIIENDANLIALAEHRHGDARGANSLVSIAVFEGIGSGIISDGTLWRGGHGAAGQLGRMLLDTEALQHVYSGFGDLETRLGSAGIARRAAGQGLVEGDEGAVLATLFHQHEEGVEAATRFLDDVFDEYAMALANVCAILDPDAIVFAGLFAAWSHVVIPALSRRLAGHVIHMPTLYKATPGLDGTLIGAADAAFERFGSVTNLL